jgi:hypothetical protein
MRSPQVTSVRNRPHWRRCVVHPDVDRAELALDARRRLLHLVVLRDVGRDREPVHLGGRRAQALLAAREERDPVALRAERARRGPPDTRAPSRDDDDRHGQGLSGAADTKTCRYLS